MKSHYRTHEVAVRIDAWLGSKEDYPHNQVSSYCMSRGVWLCMFYIECVYSILCKCVCVYVWFMLCEYVCMYVCMGSIPSLCICMKERIIYLTRKKIFYIVSNVLTDIKILIKNPYIIVVYWNYSKAKFIC